MKRTTIIRAGEGALELGRDVACHQVLQHSQQQPATTAPGRLLNPPSTAAVNAFICRHHGGAEDAVGATGSHYALMPQVRAYAFGTGTPMSRAARAFWLVALMATPARVNRSTR